MGVFADFGLMIFFVGASIGVASHGFKIIEIVYIRDNELQKGDPKSMLKKSQKMLKKISK